jgi:hypothetical protein
MGRKIQDWILQTINLAGGAANFILIVSAYAQKGFPQIGLLEGLGNVSNKLNGCQKKMRKGIYETDQNRERFPGRNRDA